MRLWLCLSWILVVACAQGESSAPPNRARAEDVQSSEQEGEDQGGVEVVDAATPRKTSRASAPDAGQARAQTGAQTGTGGARAADARDAGASESSREDEDKEKDAGLDDAATRDSGPVPSSEPEPEPEPGPKPANTGSCCSAGTGTGCGDQALQECVCALSPRCCSDTWDESCARLVREKNCQSGVRDCVCGSGEDQWQQAYCCEGGWNATCESVSIHKCGATAACP